jgi:hypothetical protein
MEAMRLRWEKKMRRQAKGLLALGAALALGAGVARADERHGSKTTAREQAGETATGSSATSERASSATGSVAREAATKEITGKVLQASPSKLYLEHMGAVVEFNIASDAKFSGGDFRSSRDLAEGQEVRASFTVENKTTNVAKEISLAGSGAASGSTGSSAPGAVPGERGSGTSPQERGERSIPGIPPREPGTTPAPR